MIANKIKPNGGESEAFVQAVADKLSVAATEIRSDANGPVENHFEAAAEILAPAKGEAIDVDAALSFKAEHPEAVEKFGQEFIAGYGSVENHSFESHGDGIFSIQGGNMAQKDVTFVIDTTPGEDNMTWLTLDNSKLKG